MIDVSKLPDDIQQAVRIESIFMPWASERRQKFYGENRAFAHYTSAEAALSIIRSKRLWMRNTNCMSDYREVQHGFDIINKFFSDPSRKQTFDDAIEGCFTGAAAEAITLFNQWWNDIRFNTYIASISEHDGDEEDLFGRLSMWRAFGGSNVPRVALVFRIPFYARSGLTLNLALSPVAYHDERAAHAEIQNVIARITSEKAFLKTLDRTHFLNMVFNMLGAAVVCLKHQGFHEELEWRVIYAPNRTPSALMQSELQTLNGVPQLIYKIPLDKTVDPAFADIDLASMFSRLIIGPSPYPWVMYTAFVDALKNCGVSDAERRVVVSTIPIRG